MTPELSLPPPALGDITASEVPPAPISVRRPPPLWPWLILALTLVGGAGLWLSRDQPAPPAAGTKSAVPAPPAKPSAPQGTAAPVQPTAAASGEQAPAVAREPSPSPSPQQAGAQPLLPAAPERQAAPEPEPAGDAVTPPPPLRPVAPLRNRARKDSVRRQTTPAPGTVPDDLIDNPYRR
jgi:hypothetical protein